MNPLAKVFLIAWVVLCTSLAYGQNLNSDSLKSLLKDQTLAANARVDVLNQLAFQNYYNNPVTALQYAFEARDISDSIKYLKGYAESMRQIGLVSWALADYSSAISYFLNGLKIAESQNYEQQEADLLANIGLVYNGMGSYTEALKFLDKSLELQRKLNNTWREAAVMNNVGDANLNLKNYDEAIEAYSHALNKSKETDYPLGITTNTRNIGNVYEAQGNYDSAVSFYSRCINLSESIHDNRGIILSNKSIASVYFKQKKFDLAQTFAKRGLVVAEKANLRAFMRDIYELLYEINEAKGNLNEVVHYLKLYSSYRDSLQNSQIASDVAAKRLAYETEKKQAEINLLRKNAELQSQIISSKSRQLIFIIVILSLSVALLALVFWNFFRVKSINNLLKKKNKEIEDQRKEIAEQRDELIALNEEIRSQQDEVVAQRDALEIKNREIEAAHRQVKLTNDNLEKIVAERTESLIRQNKSLSEYAFINAHKLRAPLASILGLIQLLHDGQTPENERGEILNHLQKSSVQLDEVVKSISKTLDEGIADPDIHIDSKS